MKTAIALWLSFGALAASAALNVYQARQPAETVVPCSMRGMGASPCSQPCRPLAETVGLTADQKQCFKAGCPGYTEKRVQLHKEIDVLVAELEEQICSENPDMDRIHGLADKIGKARGEELKSCIDSIMLVRKTLSPDQLKQLADCCEQR